MHAERPPTETRHDPCFQQDFARHAKDECLEIDAIVPRLYLSTRLLMELGKD